ncbi:MAG: AAA domain-containing protein [Fuerstiella sp.]
MTAFHSYLQDRINNGGFSTEDVLSSFLPLMKQVILTHEYGEVAPLEGVQHLQVENRRIWYAEADQRPQRRRLRSVQKMLQPDSKSFQVVDETHVRFDIEDGVEELQRRSVATASTELTSPAWLSGYVCWEHVIGHHDPVTDVFSLGLILASLACGLDLADPEDHERFVANRSNLFRINPTIHPVIARTIVVMTELDRHQRPPDLRALLATLENYRDQEVDFETDLASTQSQTEGGGDKRHVILSKLRERLFEINRRNRLLHFRSTMQTVNLTQASIPVSFDVRTIRPDQVLTWDGSFRKAVASQKPVVLNRFLNFREAVYLSGTLDRLRTEARRDENDFGFAQLRLIVAFLRWADLKAQPAERYESPLLLLPVRLSVRKGIHDRYSLQASDSTAEVNPVVRHLFRQLYDIDLPEAVELADDSLTAFAEDLRARIRASDNSVELRTVDQPRIELIHEKARRRLDQYRRRARIAGRGIRHFMDLDYSYDPVNYHPLGVRLFEQLVSPSDVHLESVIQASSPKDTTARTDSSSAVETSDPDAVAAVETDGHFYRLLDEVDDNPLNWELDLCSVTLANLKYRRMSLAQDYNRLVAENIPNPCFESTFAIDPPARVGDTTEALPLTERFHILPCDPTQSAATTQARSGRSYIVQGPPGTGKSQTIANLIADFVIRGRRILFVCEKRAAVDVVYHRLKQQGLQDLCCLIHDSQSDKKQFVMDLKQTYDDFLAEAAQPRDSRREDRDALVAAVEETLQPLADFNAAMAAVPPAVGISVRRLLDRLLLLRHRIPSLVPAQWERVPNYADVDRHRTQLLDFQKRLHRIRADGILAAHPIRLLSVAVVDAERPVELLTELIAASRTLLQQIDDRLSSLNLPSEVTSGLAQLQAATHYAQEATFLTERNLLKLLDQESALHQSFAKRLRKLKKCDAQITRAQKITRHWRRKLSSQDTQTALQLARQLQGRVLSVLQPVWWRLRRTLKSAYDFAQHDVAPSWTVILEQLDDEHEKLAARYQVMRELSDEFEIHHDLDGFLQQLQDFRTRIESETGGLSSFIRAVVAEDDGVTTLRGLAAVDPPLAEFCRTADRFLEAYEYCSTEELQILLKQLNGSLQDMPDYLHCLASLKPLPATVTDALRTLPLNLEQLEAAAAEASLKQLYRDDPELGRFDGETRDQLLKQLADSTDHWLVRNAESVREAVRQRFCDNVVISTSSATQLTPEQKELKKRYSRGRRQLEHEFGKSMRYKSIRELADGDSGIVIRDLKPVWLMSPLSVSDTLPLTAEHFDAVIFDEASQITLEDAVPALYRADQAIVVGDEMQLPPTSFFACRRSDDEELEFEEDGETVHYDLNSSSLLNHASRNLSSTMLGWHYRSRSESLISFSNHAFYGGRLLTVPEERLPPDELPELLISSPEQADVSAHELVSRPVSFHFMQEGIYEKRRNTVEAEYIAHLVRRLLLQGVGYTIGIVAFSEAQQSEIERALRSLADEDPDFAEAFEAELEREDDGQFAGLLVRNLENIQGDERDIIIMSVCYGPDPEGRTRMNFGPINMAGGEKRLNVAFSRAKQFMALVTSMKSSAITNEYNDGANCLKKYLRYAEACSQGQASAAEIVLQSLSGYRSADAAEAVTADRVTTEIADELKTLGFEVDFHVGQSHFRVDLAVRGGPGSIDNDSLASDATVTPEQAEDSTAVMEETTAGQGTGQYRLGILTDNSLWYSQPDLLERELLKPRLLQAFGWNIQVVLARDWYHDRQNCLKRMLTALQCRQPPCED